MNYLTLEGIRAKFLTHFKNCGHHHVPSSPLVPEHDPSLMFVNSGMVQFKNVFTGLEQRNYKRATSSQKCVRAGGKHNDLDSVGYTARHHTFFEMLGNFSFGDYFKEEAIRYSWDLLVNTFGLPKDKLYFTVYHDDDEASNWWKKVSGVSDERIIRIGTSDNFWSMGDTGPCGPCTEIFYDHGDKIQGGLPGTPEEGGDRYIEIWNIVFMQYNQLPSGERVALPHKSVDTGAGLERLTAVLQGVHNNYEIDMFRDIIGYAENILQVKATGEALFSYRIIADHLRAASFLIADGVVPSNEGRGYVLRRIMRRAMRHAHLLGAKEPLMHRLFPRLVQYFGGDFPEIQTAETFVSNVLQYEEDRFRATLDRGLTLLKEETNKVVSTCGILAGDVVFKLYDTYGFPVDLTQDILKSKDISIDLDGFEKCMNEQKQRARSAWSGSGHVEIEPIWFGILCEYGATDFLGYSHDTSGGVVVALIKDMTKCENYTSAGERFFLVANQTPFYGESGGQLGDKGSIVSEHCNIEVIDTKKYLGKIHVHECILRSGAIKVGDIITLSIDGEYRRGLKVNHSAVHILHAALHEIIGNHVVQKGSWVGTDRFRFDFAHIKGLSRAELKQIEDRVNDIITKNAVITTSLTSLEKAQQAGVVALFGEKYESEVRVVSIDGIGGNKPYSSELCGGTHVSRTGDIGLFKILTEGSVSAGVRRIEAVCGNYALKHLNALDDTLQELLAQLKLSRDELLPRVKSLVTENKQLKEELCRLMVDKLALSAEELRNAVKVKSVNLVCKTLPCIDSKMLRLAVEQTVKEHAGLIAVYLSSDTSSVVIVAGCSRDIATICSAGEVVEYVSRFLGGKGGGSATLAQGFGTETQKVSMLRHQLKEYLEARIL